jgi:hypothetical protein
MMTAADQQATVTGRIWTGPPPGGELDGTRPLEDGSS